MKIVMPQPGILGKTGFQLGPLFGDLRFHNIQPVASHMPKTLANKSPLILPNAPRPHAVAHQGKDQLKKGDIKAESRHGHPNEAFESEAKKLQKEGEQVMPRLEPYFPHYETGFTPLHSALHTRLPLFKRGYKLDRETTTPLGWPVLPLV